MVRVTLRRYFPELTKSILVMSPRNAPRAEAFFRGCRLQILTGSRYRGGFVGSKADQDCWMGEKVEVWRDSLATLARVACRIPQTVYKGLQKSLQ